MAWGTDLEGLERPGTGTQPTPSPGAHLLPPPTHLTRFGGVHCHAASSSFSTVSCETWAAACELGQEGQEGHVLTCSRAHARVCFTRTTSSYLHPRVLSLAITHPCALQMGSRSASSWGQTPHLSPWILTLALSLEPSSSHPCTRSALLLLWGPPESTDQDLEGLCWQNS